MTFDKDAKTTHWGKKLFFQQVVQGQLNIHRQSWVPALNHMQKKKKVFNFKVDQRPTSKRESTKHFKESIITLD